MDFDDLVQKQAWAIDTAPSSGATEDIIALHRYGAPPTHPGSTWDQSTWDQGGLFMFRNFPESKPPILLVVLVFLVSSWVWQNPGRAHLPLLLRSTRVRRALGISWNANHTPLRWF